MTLQYSPLVGVLTSLTVSRRTAPGEPVDRRKEEGSVRRHDSWHGSTQLAQVATGVGRVKT